MKTLIAMCAVVGMIGCSGSDNHRGAMGFQMMKADRGSCDRVYRNILNISSRQFGEFSTPQEHAALIELLDKEYGENGTRDKFYASCQKDMSFAQAVCSEKTNTLSGINDCVRFLPSVK